MVTARGYHLKLKVGHAQSSCCWDRKADIYGSERERQISQKRPSCQTPALVISMVMASAAIPNDSAQPSPCASVLCCEPTSAKLAICLGSEHEAGPQEPCHLVGDIMQAVGEEAAPARKHITPVKRHSKCRGMCSQAWKCPHQENIFIR